MATVFVDMELDDEDKLDGCYPCATACEPDKKLMPEYPWGLKISLGDGELKKLGLTVEKLPVKAMLHMHAMARVTGTSNNTTQDGKEHPRVELQIEQLAVESEDEENEENERAEDAGARRARPKASVMYNNSR